MAIDTDTGRVCDPFPQHKGQSTPPIPFCVDLLKDKLPYCTASSSLFTPSSAPMRSANVRLAASIYAPIVAVVGCLASLVPVEVKLTGPRGLQKQKEKVGYLMGRPFLCCC